ncbi:MAG: putative transposase [Deltaproteobacteria bacterium ADurb.Bin207]|nr:MAG: putative transposase [Deltaproteobacteria bacterium ADurb.Bin207]
MSSIHARFARRGKAFCADNNGDSLGNICRYVLRHPIGLSRLSLISDGCGAYEMKYPRGSRTPLLMERVPFLAHLASLVPPPRHPLVWYVGVLSSALRWREHVVPRSNDDKGCRQQRRSEPQGPSMTKTTDVSCTLAGLPEAMPEAAEPQAQRSYRGDSLSCAGDPLHGIDDVVVPDRNGLYYLWRLFRELNGLGITADRVVLDESLAAAQGNGRAAAVGVVNDIVANDGPFGSRIIRIRIIARMADGFATGRVFRAVGIDGVGHSVVFHGVVPEYVTRSLPWASPMGTVPPTETP